MNSDKRTKKILAVCLVIATISTIITVISSLIKPEQSSMPIMLSSIIVPLVLCFALYLSSKKDDDK